ncbi:MAG: DoxX family protein [Acidimicrobiia bacterium]|nr:DoxX family protein [Acidimicrobiia bacterium]
MAGIMKMTQTKEKLAENMGWVEHYKTRAIRLIGLLEALGAIGLILPAVTNILPILTPLAVIGIALVMVRAMSRQLSRGNETQMVVMNMTFLLMALFVAWGRFGDYAF